MSYKTHSHINLLLQNTYHKCLYVRNLVITFFSESQDGIYLFSAATVLLSGGRFRACISLSNPLLQDER